MNLDLVTLSVVAPGATGTAMAVIAGDTASIRNAPMGSDIIVVAAWCKSQLVGSTSIVFPSGHDMVRGERVRNIAQNPFNFIPEGFEWKMRPQDQVAATQIGSVTAGDVELLHLLLWYADLPGISGRLIDSATLEAKAVALVTIEDTLTATVASTYSGARAINAASDLLKANTDYAVIGGLCTVVGGALTIRGADSGGMRSAFPCNPLITDDTLNWFPRLSDTFKRPMIPVFNSGNKAGTFIELVQDENLVAVPFTLQLAQLAP